MSPYNIVDLIVYTLPLAGGIVGIVQRALEVETKALRVWSFAILFIYIHIVSRSLVIMVFCPHLCSKGSLFLTRRSFLHTQ